MLTFVVAVGTLGFLWGLAAQSLWRFGESRFITTPITSEVDTPIELEPIVKLRLAVYAAITFVLAPVVLLALFGMFGL